MAIISIEHLAFWYHFRVSCHVAESLLDFNIEVIVIGLGMRFTVTTHEHTKYQ